MGTLGTPKVWVTYINPRDCSQAFCSLSCPQWCYLIFSPPPPLLSFSDDSSSGSTFSPFVLILIGALVSAFLLVSYYIIISKYCGNSERSRRHQSEPLGGQEDEENVERETLNEHEAWAIRTIGLDETLIKNITLVKYNKGDRLHGSEDCSICLGEFQEDDFLRLLPKCNHAFHVECIDTWLRSHSNCPICRATLFTTTRPPNHPPQEQEPPTQIHVENEVYGQEGASRGCLPKCPSRVLSDIMRRSRSMDHFHETRVFISGILRFNLSIDMQRSFSSGRFLVTNHGGRRNAIIPL